MRNILSLAVALLALLSAPAAATTELYLHKDGSMSSSFLIEEPGGCIRTDISISAYESLAKMEPGALEPTSMLRVSITRYDWCGQTFLMWAHGSTTAPEISVRHSMTAAWVRGQVELYDYVTGASSAAEVALTWDGGGPITVSRGHDFYYDPSTRTLSHGSYRYREAAVRGAVLQDGVDLVAGLSGDGKVYWEQGKWVAITRSEALTATLQPATAITDREVFSYRGGNASANFAELDPTGCITTEIFFSASDSRERYGEGGWEPALQIVLHLLRTDWCNSVVLMQASEVGFTGSVQVSPALKGAAVNGTMQLYDDVTGSYFTVAVDLAWREAGPISDRRQRGFYDAANIRQVSRESGRSRAAEASGTLLQDGANLLTGPSQSARLFYGQGTTVWWH